MTTGMKRLSALLLAGTLALGLAGCAVQNSAEKLPETITVGGSGEIKAAPDIAILRLGVESRGATPEAARASNSEAINATMEAVKAAGVDEADIQTSNIYLRNNYDGNGNVSGYRMSVDMEIIVRDIDKAGEVIDASIAAGTNSLDRVSYGLSNESERYGQALEAAVQSARQSAERIAAAEGRTVGKMLSVTESGTGITVYANPDTGGGTAVMGAARNTSVMKGTESVRAELQVVFELL